MKNSLLILFFLLGISVAKSQNDCTLYFPEVVNNSVEIRNFDGRDRLTSTQISKLKEKKVENGAIKLLVDVTTTTASDNKTNNASYELVCQGGEFVINFRNMFNPATLGAYQDMELSFTGDNLRYPSSMNVGDSLPNASANMKVLSSGIQIMSMDMKFTSRKVDAKESVTVTGGTFDCIKLSYNYEVKSIFKAQGKSVEWYAKNVGLVKRENYDSKGKLVDRSELFKITR